MRAYFASLWGWARGKPYFWASVGLAAGTLLVIFVVPGVALSGAPSDGRLRLWATVLQLIGAGVAIRDLMRRARRHGEPGVIASWVAWLTRGARIALRRTTMAQASGTASITLGGVATTGSAGVLGPRPAPSLEDRVAAIEEKIKRMDESHALAVGELQAADRHLQEELRGERAAREALGSAAAAREREAAVGDLGVLWFGAWWVLIGTTLSGLAPEIHGLWPPRA